MSHDEPSPQHDRGKATHAVHRFYDARARAYLPFGAPRPAEHWRATWALSLSPIDAKRTRLRVRSRVAFTGDALRWTAVWMHPFHDFMGRHELRYLKRAAESGGAPAGRQDGVFDASSDSSTLVGSATRTGLVR